MIPGSLSTTIAINDTKDVLFILIPSPNFIIICPFL